MQAQRLLGSGFSLAFVESLFAELWNRPSFGFPITLTVTLRLLPGSTALLAGVRMVLTTCSRPLDKIAHCGTRCHPWWRPVWMRSRTLRHIS